MRFSLYSGLSVFSCLCSFFLKIEQPEALPTGIRTLLAQNCDSHKVEEGGEWVCLDVLLLGCPGFMPHSCELGPEKILEHFA